MDNMIRMQFVNGRYNLSHDYGYLWLAHLLVLLQIFVQLPTKSHLHDDVYVCLVVEVAVHFYYVGMVQECLYFQLTDELLSYLFLL